MAGCWGKKMKFTTFQDLLDAGFKYGSKIEPKGKHGSVYIVSSTIGQDQLKIYKEYITSCFDENKNQKCHKEGNGFALCKICPKAEGNKDGKKEKKKS